MTQHDDEITNLQKRNDSDYTDRASGRLRALRPITVEDFDRVAALNARGSDAFELLNRNAADARSMGLVPMYHAKGVNEAEGMFATSRSSRFLTSASGQMSEALVSYVTKEQRAQAWQHAQQDPGSAGQKGTFYFPKSMNVQWALAGTPPSQVPQSSLENAQNAEDALRQGIFGIQGPSPMQERLSSEMPASSTPPARVLMGGAAAGRVDVGMGDRNPGRPESFGERVARGQQNLAHLTGLGGDAARPDPVLGVGYFGFNQEAGLATAAFQAPGSAPGDMSRTILSQSNVAAVQRTVGRRFSEAVGQYGGMADPISREMSIYKHTAGSIKEISQRFGDEAQALERAGDSIGAAEKREVQQAAVTAATKLVTSATKALSEGAEKDAVINLGKSAQYTSIGQLKGMLEGKTGLSEQARAELGMSVEQAGGIGAIGRMGGAFRVPTGTGGTGSIYVPPGGGREDGAGGGGQGGGMWGGGLGAALYGTYIAKRFWGYTGQPVMQATEEYAKVQAGLAPMLSGEVPTGGAATLTARRAAAKYAVGEAGYDLYGGVLGAFTAQQSTSLGADISAGTGIFGGAAIGASIFARVAPKLGSFTFPQATGGVEGALAGRTITGQAVGGALRTVGGFAGAAAIGYAGLSVASSIYEGQGRDISPWDTAGAGLQSIMRLNTGIGLLGAGAIAGAAGGATGDRIRSNVTSLMQDTKYGQWLSTDIGYSAPGTGLASGAEIAKAATDLNISAENLKPLLAGAYGISGQSGFGPTNVSLVTALNKMVQTEGMTEAGAATALGGYGDLLGYMPGEKGAVSAGLSYAGMDLTERALATRGATRRAGLAGMARQFVGTNEVSEPSLRSMMGMYGTQQQGQIGIQTAGQLIGAGMGGASAMWSGIGLMQGVQTGQYTTNQAQFAGSMMANIAGAFAPGQMAGLMSGATRDGGGQMGFGSTNVMMDALASLTPAQQSGVGAIWSGDIQGMSTAARTGNLGGWAAFNDRAGRPMYQTNVGAAVDQWRAFDQFQGTNYSGLAGQYLDPGTSPNMAAASGMGIWGQGATATASGKLQASMNVSGYGLQMSGFARSAIDQGYRGLTGLNALGLKVSDAQFGAQMGQGALQLEGIEAKQQMLWGGGSWDRPAAGSLWGLEDRQRGIQWGSTQQDWTAQRQRSAMGQAYSVAGEGIQQERMTASRGYQQYQFGYERSGQLLQRQWTQQDNQYEDTMRGLQFGWGMEDVNEQIRFSTGRQRRNLVKQRGRMVTQGNLEEEQVDRTREREKQVDAREDEQFQKRVEYFEKTAELEDKQFELQVKHREETYAFETKEFERHVKEQQELHKINEEMIKINRKYQAEDMERQKESIKLSMGAAAVAKEYADILAYANENQEKMTGHIKTMSEQEKAIAVAKEVANLARALNNTDLAKIRAWIQFLKMELQT